MSDFLITVASYPRSGQVWLMRMLARALKGKAGTRLPQDVGRDIAAEVFGLAPVEVHRTHGMPLQILDVGAAFKEGSRVPDRTIHIVRDPRDVLCSNWRYRFGGPDDGGIEAAFERMVGHGNWRRFVELWEGVHGRAQTHQTIRYEDLRADPVGTVMHLLTAFDSDHDFTVDDVTAAVEAETFAKREAQLTAGHGPSGWTDGGAEVSNRQARRHLGRAKVGGWPGEISAPMLAELEEKLAAPMARFGYEPAA